MSTDVSRLNLCYYLFRLRLELIVIFVKTITQPRCYLYCINFSEYKFSTAYYQQVHLFFKNSSVRYIH